MTSTASGVGGGAAGVRDPEDCINVAVCRAAGNTNDAALVLWRSCRPGEECFLVLLCGAGAGVPINSEDMTGTHLSYIYRYLL